MNRRDYCKLEIIWVKYAPVISALLITLNSLLCTEKPELGLIDYLCLPSIVTIGHFYLLRKIVGLCLKHRLFIDYSLCVIILRLIHDIYINYIGEVNELVWRAHYLVLFIGFLGLIIYYHVKDNKESITDSD